MLNRKLAIAVARMDRSITKEYAQRRRRLAGNMAGPALSMPSDCYPARYDDCLEAAKKRLRESHDRNR